MDTIFTTLVNNQLFLKGIKSILIILAGILINWIINKIIKRSLLTTKHLKKVNENAVKRLKTIIKLINDIVRAVVWLIILLTILPIWGFDITPILTGAGILGLAIGFGSKELVKDLVAGFFIIFEGAMNTGDHVEIAGVKGKVLSIGMRTTRLKDEEGNIVIIPNGSISKISRLK